MPEQNRGRFLYTDMQGNKAAPAAHSTESVHTNFLSATCTTQRKSTIVITADRQPHS